MMADFRARYMDGEFDSVWQDLLALGPTALEPPHLEDATAIAEEAVRRMIHNAEATGDYLRNAGYEFRTPGPFVVPARQDAATWISRIEDLYGAVPLLLRVWWQHVDHLNHEPTDSFRESRAGCVVDGIYPVNGILIDSPEVCLKNSQQRAVEIADHIESAEKAGLEGEREYYADAANLIPGPGTSAHDPVGYRLPLNALDGTCHPTADGEKDECLLEWLRFYSVRRGGLGWQYFGAVSSADGGLEMRSFIRPPEEVESIVASMNLLPF